MSEPLKTEMTCSCRAHVAYKADGADNIRVILEKVEWCPKHGAVDELVAALEAMVPEGWDDGTMDHMPGIKQARAVLAKVKA